MLHINKQIVKHFLKSIYAFLFFCLTISVTCSFAQKYSSIDSVPGAPVFVYTHNTALEIIKDKKFIVANAKNFLDFSNSVLEQGLLSDSARDHSFLAGDIEMANLIFGNYKEAEKTANAWLAKNSSDYNFLWLLPDKVFLDVKTGKAASYSIAILNELKHCNRQSLEYYDDVYYGSGMFNYNSRFFSQMAFAYLSSDTGNFRKTIEQNISPLDKNDKKLSMMQFGDFLYVYGESIVADAVVNDFTKTSPFDLAKWENVWNSMLYHFTKKNSLHDVLACNYQVFDRNFFDPKILWHNPGEIPGNHIDDDGNGIIDDVNGYEYNVTNQKIKEPVELSWKETDSVAVMEQAAGLANKMSLSYGGAVEEYKSRLDHGSMSIELMLKNNPRVQFMALEQNQLTGDHNYIPDYVPTLFTGNIAYNQHLVDSLVTLFIGCFQEMAEYCNRYQVRVVEINSMNVSEKDLFFKRCGTDSAQAKEFAKRMFSKMKDGLAKAYIKAPNTLYINSAGNDNVNIDSIPNLVNFIHLPNVVIAGALYKDLHKTSYSNYGKGVDVFAPAHFPLHLVKLESRRDAWRHNESGGTSAAAPVIANMAIQMLELNPGLSAAQVKQLIINGADKEPYEKGINIINPAKTIILLKAK